ncbi:MAG: alkaline shock response membrane anchor protein AmaP [Firmicutes bacterium]|nr:alkaline shock response membrane anchor protein AmaP [Bacillota bacterium]
MIDRLLLRTYSFLVLVGVIWMALWLIGLSEVHYATIVLIDSGWMWAYAAIVFVVTLRFAFLPLARREAHSFVRSSEAGEVRIGFAAVNELARRTAAQMRGVARLQTNVIESPEGLVVRLHVRADAGVDLTALSEQMQAEVARAIFAATSLHVHAVHVQIVDLAPAVVAK